MGNASSSEVASRLKTQKYGNHVEREKKAMERVKRLRENENIEKEIHLKNQQKNAAHALWHELGDDIERNVVEPLKHWSGIKALQECSQPKAHVDSDDDDIDNIQIPKNQNISKPPQRTAREKVHDMVRDHHPEFRHHDDSD